MSVGDPLIQIRPVTNADIPGLAGVQLRSALAGFSHIFPETLPKPTQRELEEEWAALVTDAEKVVLAATVDGEMVAVTAFGPDVEPDKGTEGILLKIYVDPARFGQGIGSALHERAVAWFRTQDYSMVRLWVLEANTLARQMYERRGWKRRPWVRSDWPGSDINEIGYVLDLR